MYQRGNKSGDDRGGKKFGGGSKFGKRSFGGDRGFRDGGRPQMHKAMCDECGRPCEVPFKPTGDRPVYCNSCFKKGDNSGGGNFKRPERDSGKNYGGAEKSYGGGAPKGNSGDFQKQFDILNGKLDQILEALTGIAEEAEYEEDEDDDEEDDDQDEGGDGEEA